MHDANSILDSHYDLAKITDLLANKTSLRNTTDDIIKSIDIWIPNIQRMKDWNLWVDKKRELAEMQLRPVISLLERGNKPSDSIQSFLKGIYHHLIEVAIDSDEQLRTFNGIVFRQKIEQYKRDTYRFQELSKKELYSKLAARVPSSAAASADGSEISILKRNIANGGRGNSIRSIIDNIPTLLPRLCPCMLMSPISVAQYIDLKSEKFDLVIFDEASQMPTSEAVGAIGRGKALIVVGDSKQMPPTSFFSSTQVDEEEANIDDMESILDDCKTLSLREYYLSWHYRSKHESLIAFSNSQYYDNRLFTFPSIDDKLAKVKLVPVEGVYDKGRTRSNPEEYESDFLKFAKQTDIFVSCHFWDPKAPVYLEQEDFHKYDLPIKMIGDITCDISGSIKSTIRPATHAEPYYDFNPVTYKEELSFSSKENVTVMAVDTCPNALAIDASEYFGDMLTEYVFKPLLRGEHSDVIDRSTILRKGQLTLRFDYLKDFAEG